MSWSEIKYWLADASGLSMDALHVHAGVLAQLLVAMLTKRRLASPIPWLVVALLALGNEYYDLEREAWTDRAAQRLESLTDLWNTMLLPTVLLAAARFAPGRISRTGSAAPPPAPASGRAPSVPDGKPDPRPPIG